MAPPAIVLGPDEGWRVAADGLGDGPGAVGLAELPASRSAPACVPLSSCVCGLSRPCASALTATKLPVVAVTAPSSQAPAPIRNPDRTGS